MLFLERLKKARIEKGISQSALARSIGVTASAISQMELGITKNPSSEKLLPIARALGVDPEWLISGKGSKNVKVSSGEALSFEENEFLQTLRELTPKQRDLLLTLAKEIIPHKNM